MHLNKDEEKFGTATEVVADPKPKKKISSGEKWGFSFMKRVTEILVPNGMGRYGRHPGLNGISVSRIPYLSEEMIGKVVDAVVNQHNHYLIKLFTEVDSLINKLQGELKVLEATLDQLPFYKGKRIREVEDDQLMLIGQIESLKVVQAIMEKLVPDNVAEAPEEKSPV